MQILLVVVSVSVEDERLFSALNLVLNKLRQSLSSHLEACVRVDVQTSFTVEDFPFDLALEVLRAQEDRYVEEKSRKQQQSTGGASGDGAVLVE